MGITTVDDQRWPTDLCRRKCNGSRGIFGSRERTGIRFNGRAECPEVTADARPRDLPYDVRHHPRQVHDPPAAKNQQDKGRPNARETWRDVALAEVRRRMHRIGLLAVPALATAG